jgi:hypothetical protein
MMDHAANPSLDMLLDRLATRGSLHLARMTHNAAITAALISGAWVAVAASALVLAMAVTVGADTTVIVAGWLGLIAAAAAGTYWWRRSGRGGDRTQALALFDRALDLKDRVTVTAEFLAVSSRDGFQAAALDEARPWVARAADAPLLANPPGAPARLWPLMLVALTLLAAALIVEPQYPTSAAPRPHATAVSALIAAARRVSIGSHDGAATTIAALLSGNRGGPSGSDRTGTDRARATSGGARASATGVAAGAELGGSARARAGQAGEATGGASPGERGTTGSSYSDASSAGNASAAGNGHDAERADGGHDVSAKANGAGLDHQAAGLPMPAAGGHGGMPPTTPRDAPAAPPAGENHGSPNQGAQNKPGQSGGKKGGQGGGQGQAPGQGQGSGSGRGAGQDAIKQTRGGSTLLLAVPAEDRLIGTPNPARIGSTIRPGTPRATATAVQASAQERGRNDGNAGQILHAMGTAHDDRVLRDYFRLRRGEPADARGAAAR